MTVTVTSFRSNFPEFSSIEKYPNAGVQFWLTIASKMLIIGRWGGAGEVYDLGLQMFMGHHLTLEALAQAEARNGGIPGGTVGPINNKSVDKVSVGYDTGSGIEEDAGHWNLSVYGTRFVSMFKMMGAGPIQSGIGCDPYGGALSAGNAWAGPWSYNFPNPSD